MAFHYANRTGCRKYFLQLSDGGAPGFPVAAFVFFAGEGKVSVWINADKEQLAVNSGRKRDANLVSCDGRSYEVGKDVRHSLVASVFGRDMTDSYYESMFYHGFMCGALAYMGDDSLALGLLSSALRLSGDQCNYASAAIQV